MLLLLIYALVVRNHFDFNYVCIPVQRVHSLNVFLMDSI